MTAGWSRFLSLGLLRGQVFEIGPREVGGGLDEGADILALLVVRKLRDGITLGVEHPRPVAGAFLTAPGAFRCRLARRLQGGQELGAGMGASLSIGWRQRSRYGGVEK